MLIMKDKLIYIKSVERAMELINCFSVENPEISVTELSKTIGASKATAYKLLQSLAKYGFVMQNSVNQKYRLGYGILHFAEIYQKSIDIRNFALPYLQELHYQTQETISLNVAMNDMRVCIEKIESNYDLRQAIEIGKSYPLYKGSAGKTLLAYMKEEFILKLLENYGIQSENDVKVEKKSLMEELKTIREKGYATSSGELVMGVFSVSAPIFDQTANCIACITVGGPEIRIDSEKTIFFTKSVIDKCQKISKLLGYSKRLNELAK